MRSRDTFQPKVVRYIVQGAAQEAARSLELLRAIETTVEVNNLIAEAFEHINHRITASIEAVCARPSENPAEPIDADGSIRAMAEQALDVFCSAVQTMSSKRDAALRDGDLSHEDGVVESYDRVMEALTDSHGLINELNWAIMEHDADRSPLSGKGPFTSAKELLAALSD